MSKSTRDKDGARDGPETAEGNRQFERFQDLVRRVVSVPRDEVEKQKKGQRPAKA